MTKRKSINFLPNVFQTLTNKRFLNATVDQLIEEPALKKIYGYIGQQDQSPVFKSSDYYIAEGDTYGQFYQLEPGVVIKKTQNGGNTYKIDNVLNYPDLLNQISGDGGLNNDHQRLFTNRYYSYDGFIDLDKITNYRQYYWVPTGPYTVDVTAGGSPLEATYNFNRISYVANNQTELQSASIGKSGYNVTGFMNAINPTLTLVRGGKYTFNLGQTGHNMYIQTEIGTSGVSNTQSNISTRDIAGLENNGISNGSMVFHVPLSTAQDYLLALPNLQQRVDMIVDVPYALLQSQNYDDFIINYSLDGVRSFDTKYIVINNTIEWGNVPSSQYGGVWQITIDNNPVINTGETIAVINGISFDNAVTSIVVPNTTNVAVGQTIVGQGIKTGTKIIQIVGNTIVFDNPTTKAVENITIGIYTTNSIVSTNAIALSIGSTTTAFYTSGSTSVELASVQNVSVGQLITGLGIPTGTIITNITDRIVTLNNSTTAHSSDDNVVTYNTNVTTPTNIFYVSDSSAISKILVTQAALGSGITIGTTVTESTGDVGWDSETWDNVSFDKISYGNIINLSKTIATTGTIDINFFQNTPNPNYRNMNLTYVTDWNSGYKIFVTQGAEYGHTYAYKDNSGTITKFPTLSASKNILYYVDADDPLIYGEIRLVDPEPSSVLNVNDIIGRSVYTSPNGVQFTNGLKVQFTGTVTPSSYKDNIYIVEGVGTSIKLVDYNSLVTPEIINTNAGDFFGEDHPYGIGGYSGTTNSPEEKDYVTINRSSVDGNGWSRNNRWFHRDVLQAAANYTNKTFVFDANQQAKRPIIEFQPKLKLWNYGTNYASTVTCIDNITTNAFSQVEGQNSYSLKTNGSYNSDGIQLLDGVTVLFVNDTNPTVRSTIYKVQANYIRAGASPSFVNKNTYAFNSQGSNKINCDTGGLSIGQLASFGALYNEIVSYTAGQIVHYNGTTFIAIQNSHGILPLNTDYWTIYSNAIAPNTTITSIDSTNNVVYLSSNLLNDIPTNTTINFDNSANQIHLIPIKSCNDGDNIVVMEGNENQGNVFFYENGHWNLAQIRNSRPQFPLFDVIDINGNSLGNQDIYPSSSFAGSNLFGYAIGSSSTNSDKELGFPLVYQNIGNIGDIVFNNYYLNDTFSYNVNNTSTHLAVNYGFAAVINGWKNYNFANGWSEVVDKSKQYITKTFTATDVKNNNFDIGVIYNNSYFENNLFVYVNGVLQESKFYNLNTNSNTSIIAFNTNLKSGDRLFVKINGKSNVYGQTYTMPKNLVNNSENTEFKTITLGQIRNHLIEIGTNTLGLVGNPAGINNFRDLNYKNIGGKLLQHSASLRTAAIMLSNNDVNPFLTITHASNSYQNFKSQLIDFINKLQFNDPTNYRECLDTVLQQFVQNANYNNNFAYTDMIAGGNNYIVNDYLVQNTNYRTYNLVNSYQNKAKSFNAVLVYYNNNLLLNEIDYTIDNFSVTLSNDLVLKRLDKITIYEYASTIGCNVPATPTKLGLYPAFKPEIVADETYLTPQVGIVGHDGSFTIAWGDYRDNILLEYEKRVYNNISVKYANNPDYDLTSVEPGAFRATDYSFAEWTQLLSSSYLTWANQNNVDIFTNNTVSNDLFSFNYAAGNDRLFGNNVPGYWRGIYQYFYDTDRPHTHPWEMLGYVQKPSWWNFRYGPAPYSSENKLLWSDLELGFIYNGSPSSSYINPSYSRPGLSKIIPVDIHGNLLPPMQSVIANYDANTATGVWTIGDQSPQETAWRRSSAFPFAKQLAWFLARPAQYCALKYNTRDIQFNKKLNQIINISSNNRIFDYSINSENEFIPGLNVWIRDYLVSNNLDPVINWIDVAKNSTFNLVYKMAGFTDKSYLTITADQVSPQSKNTSVLIPSENYKIKVSKGAPVSRAIYSAVVVQKVPNGYQVSGFDTLRPYFLTVPSRVSPNNFTIKVGNDSAVIYQDTSNTIVTYPYGSVFPSAQQTIDFLVSYGRYLVDQGFIFNDTVPGTQTVADWTLAAKEFLFWNQQNWGDNTVIGLTPAGTSIKFASPFGVVDKISNTNNHTKVIDSDGTILSGKDYRVYRENNTFSIDLKNSQKGIHLLDISIVQYEHVIIFDNQTVFNDILYDEQVGSRQFRLRLDGVKTQDWNGSIYAPGFFVNVTDIPNWQTFTDYYKGDIVLFKTQYYAAQNFIPGASSFVASDWYLINGNLLDKQLIPNMASGAAQFSNFYNPDVADLNTAADLLSKQSTGFQQRQYFTDLGSDITTQYKFYLGMIKQKGSQAVINAFLRNTQNNLDSDITLLEQWAIKLGNYGGTNNVTKIEFSIGNSQTINGQYLFEFINQNDSRSTEYNSVKPSDLLIAPQLPQTYTTTPFVQTEISKQIVPYAGPVNPLDANASVYDINKIYNISSLSPVLGESSKIWIAADNANEWGVYRLSRTGSVFINYVNQTSPTELTFTTNIAHNLLQYDYIMIKHGSLINASSSTGILDLSGFYRISSVSGNTFTVKIFNNITVASGTLAATLFKLTNVRYSTISDWSNFTPVRGWDLGEIVYIDNGPTGWEVKQNTDSWAYSGYRSPVFTSPSDYFGSSIKINSTQGFAVVGAVSKNNTGQAFIYGKSSDNVWQEYGIISPDSRAVSFGSNVDINSKNIAAITAPSYSKGAVYLANVMSDSINLTQAIHYDNLYVISAAISTSNSYVLIGNTTIQNSTANAATQGGYNLSNFAVGMNVGGAGIPSGTKIANLNAATKTVIGMSNTAPIDYYQTATILTGNAGIYKTLYANLTSSNANIYISNTQSISGLSANTMPVIGNLIPPGTYITNLNSDIIIPNVGGFHVLTLSNNVLTGNNAIITFVAANSYIAQSVTAITPNANAYFVTSGIQNLQNVTVGSPIIGSVIPNGTVITSLIKGSPYNTIGLTNNVTIAPNQKIAIYSNIAPTSVFGSSVALSNDGNWMYVGEPTQGRVFVYKWQNVNGSFSYRVGDGSTTTFYLPTSAIGLNLGSRDIKVYVSSILQIPDLDYIKTPGQDSITFAFAPSTNAKVYISYENYYKEINQIVTDDPDAIGFGTTVHCTDDGRQVIVGAPKSNATLTNSYSGMGKVYVFERTVENFLADGSKSTFSLSNALSYSDTITTANLITSPSVTVDSNNSNAMFNYANNSVTLSSLPPSGSIISVSTNQFVVTKIATADIGQLNAYFGQSVKINKNGCDFYVGATGVNTNSTNNGAVYHYVDIPRKYGVATGTISNVNMTPGLSMRINDWLVTFTGDNANSCVQDINSADIPGITASLTDIGYIEIKCDIQVAYNKMRLRNEYGDPLNAMGIVPWQMTQKMFSPLLQDTQNFGDHLAISPDNNTLVVGATIGNSKIVTSFDGGSTTFDQKTIQFFSIIYRSGAAHVFEYQPSKSETANDQGLFAYGRMLMNNNAHSLDAYSTAIDISDNYILVGAPHAQVLGNATGSMYVYYNQYRSRIWNIIRSKDVDYDSRMIDRIYIYDNNYQQLIANLPIIDLTHNFLPQSSESYIDYVINYDPAVYNNVPSTISFSYDTKNNWGAEHVGKLWWDTNSIKYYDNRQGSTLNKFNYWGLAFPESIVNVYEWIESDLLPKDYAKKHRLSGPLYTVNDVYSTRVIVDPATGVAVTRYYFWVRNSTLPDSKNIRSSALEIQNSIATPRNSNEPFAAVISASAIAIYNAHNLVNDTTNLVIEYKNTLEPQPVHSEWTMFDDGSEFGIAPEFIDKLNYSLAGQDNSGKIVPDPNLPEKQKYGMEIRPRQSLFASHYTARKLYVEEVNKILTAYPMVLTRSAAITKLNNSSALPSADVYTRVVDNLEQLSYLDINSYNDGDKILVLNDNSTWNQGWSLYQLNIKFPNTRSWNIIQVQTYNLNNYWSYADWYSSKYNPQNPINHTLDKENEITSLKLYVNDIIYIKNSNSGGWKIVLVNDNNLELLAQQNATIQLNENLYSYQSANQGFASGGLETVGFDTDSNLEFLQIFNIVRDQLLNNEYRTSFKAIISLMLDTIAQQNLSTDWLMKTSFVDIYNRVRGLEQLPVYLPQPENIVTDFFAEIKPYHTKLKKYVAKYDNSKNLDIFQTNMTDFDLQPYYNRVIEKYHSPQLNNVLDNDILATSSVYAPWISNHGYEIVRIDVGNGGNGYDGSTTVIIEGDGESANATPHILNGSIYTITVDSSTSDFTVANVRIIGTGTGATAVPIFGNGVVRNLNTHVKFDRYTYFNSITDWNPNTVYTINDVVVYNKQPYRTTTAHTSTANFDVTKFLLLHVKIWYPETNYSQYDIVVYQNTGYEATNNFTSSLLFDTNNLTPYSGLFLDNAADRIWAYYSPLLGMAGRDLAQLMVGIEYGGVGVQGPNFKTISNYDIDNYDTLNFDYVTKNTENVINIDGIQKEDTIIQSKFTDSGLGLRTEDIVVLGNNFVDSYNSNAPEELLPAITFDTLDIKVRTLPIKNGNSDMKVITVGYSGQKTFSFDSSITGVSYPIGGIEKFLIIDKFLGPIAENVDYTVNWQTSSINLNYTPTRGTYWYVIMIGNTGLNPVFDQNYVASGTTTDFALPNNVIKNVQQAYVKVNGQSVNNWTLVNSIINNENTLTVRFDTPPVANSFIQIHLYNVALGSRAYSEIYEETYTISTANYPNGYNFILSNPEEYQAPNSMWAMVRLNGSDLFPPQQSYYTADGTTKNYSLVSDWVEDISKITDGEIIVTVNNIVVNRGFDYTVYHDPANTTMPVIQFYVAPLKGSKIIISDSSQSDFKIYNGNILWLNPNLVIPNNSKLTVMTQGNHDSTTLYVKLFSGSASASAVIDDGIDVYGFDTFGFDNELNSYLPFGTQYILPAPVYNLNQIYITRKITGATGGIPLIPYTDYKLVNPTTIQLSSTLNVSASDIMCVRIWDNSIREEAIEFRLFKDLQNNVRYYAVRPNKSTFLTRDLHLSDDWIYCQNVANLTSPDPMHNLASVIIINGERITYGIKDAVNNRLGQLRRGSAGTGAAAVHTSGSLLIDSSLALEVPNSRDNLVTVPDYSNIRDFSNTTTYPKNSVVLYNNVIYKSIKQTVGNLPTDILYWTPVNNFNQGPVYLTNNTGQSVLIEPGQNFYQGINFINQGESLQTSQTLYAKFLREQ